MTSLMDRVLEPLWAQRERREAKEQERWDREHRWDRLATYNAERARGIVHTPEYAALMAEEQEEFDWDSLRRRST